MKDYEPKFIIEGWIEAGDYPYVQVTHNIPFFASMDSAQFEEVIIRWAKVTVSDGEKTEVLTAGSDKSFFPPYVYRGTELKGEAGKNYTLKVEYAGNILTSSTSIPPAVPIDSIWFETKNNSDTLLQLNIRFRDNAGEKNFYKIYTRRGSEKRFIPSLLSNQDDKYFNGKELTLAVNSGPENNLTSIKEPYFVKGDTVFVKLSSIPQSGFEFWNSFQDEVLSVSNPLLGSTGKIKTNIEGNGAGIWCGYGSSVYRVVAQP